MFTEFHKRLNKSLKFIVTTIRTIELDYLKTHNISISDKKMNYIIAISDNEGKSQKEIIDIMQISPGAFSVEATFLRTQGYINKIQDKDDNRKNNLYLTEKGKHIVKIYNEIRTQIANKYKGIFSEEDLNQLDSLMSKIETEFKTKSSNKSL